MENSNSSIVRIGVVGYSSPDFNKIQAYNILLATITSFINSGKSNLEIVSGYTNFGMPAIAYEIAKQLQLKTAGVACRKAEEFECYPCDRVQIVGSKWGDESSVFLKQLDILIHVGGGDQSLAECQAFKKTGKPLYEFELEAI